MLRGEKINYGGNPWGVALKINFVLFYGGILAIEQCQGCCTGIDGVSRCFDWNPAKLFMRGAAAAWAFECMWKTAVFPCIRNFTISNLACGGKI